MTAMLEPVAVTEPAPVTVALADWVAKVLVDELAMTVAPADSVTSAVSVPAPTRDAVPGTTTVADPVRVDAPMSALVVDCVAVALMDPEPATVALLPCVAAAVIAAAAARDATP
jgi:hypothetical protein